MNLFDHEDDKARQRVGVKMAAFAEESKQRLEEIKKADAAKLERMVEFTKETSRRCILADYASMNEEPIYTAGILISPMLVAYGKRVAEQMKQHAAESDARARKEAGQDGKRKRH